jgi:hypothetical protein
MFKMICKAFSDYREKKITVGSFLVGLYFLVLAIFFVYQVGRYF